MRRPGRSWLRRRDLGPAAHRHREAFMIGLPDGVRVYLAAGRTDLRRGIDGLAAQIQTVLRENPFSGHLFIFRGRAAHTIKVLMYDGSGFLLMQKRLTEGKFIWPSPADGIVTISRAQMSLLIDGLGCSLMAWIGDPPRQGLSQSPCLSSEQRSLLLLYYCFCCGLPRGLARILSLHG